MASAGTRQFESGEVIDSIWSRWNALYLIVPRA